MTGAPGKTEIERFRALVMRRIGLQFDDAKLGLLAEVLQRRLQARGAACGDYLASLDVQTGREEIAALAEELTVPETYFFRNIDQFRALAEVALPGRMSGRVRRPGLAVLSAGCASGEEAYSIAMVVLGAPLVAEREVSIRAVDINPAMLAKATQARFSSWVLRETPPDIQQRWFRQQGQEFVLDDAVRAAVRFEERNLVDDDAELWRSGSYDVVFCRNVIMYFSPLQAEAVIARIACALAPGGYLFLGHAETLRGLSRDFHLRHTHGTFYYQRKDGAEANVPRASADATAAAEPPLAAFVESDGAWIDAIGRAAERIRALTQTPAHHAGSGGRPVPGWDLGLALDLLRRERFEEALSLVGAFPRESARDPEVVLLRAVLLAHSGRLTEAERACWRLIEIDGMSAGAHYVLALCREGMGDPSRAADHDQVAVYLDPDFAMPRLHLGLIARRSGDSEAARRELDQALILLQREDPSRLLLFGGGFSRETLLALCRAELRAC